MNCVHRISNEWLSIGMNNIQVNMLSFAVNVNGPDRSSLLCDSCLQSTMDGGHIRDGPFHFWGRIEFFKHLFAILTWKHVRTTTRLTFDKFVVSDI